jgi:hypothetical protein
MMKECPLEGFDEFVRMNVVPRCFHCGNEYVKDEKYCCAEFNVFKPVCDCLNKATIRILVDIK